MKTFLEYQTPHDLSEDAFSRLPAQIILKRGVMRQFSPNRVVAEYHNDALKLSIIFPNTFTDSEPR